MAAQLHSLDRRPPANDPIPVDLLLAGEMCRRGAENLQTRTAGISVALEFGVELGPVIEAARIAAREAATIARLMDQLAETLALIEARRAR